MSIEGWFIFATFWVLFVTTPGPNAVNCIQTAIDIGFRKSPDLCPWDPNAGMFVPWTFGCWGICVDFNIAIAV